MQVKQKLIYIYDLGTLQDQVNTIQNQMNIILKECNATEVAIYLLCTKLVEAHNITNALAHTAPAAATATTAATTTATAATTPALMHAVDKILFPDEFDSTQS